MDIQEVIQKVYGQAKALNACPRFTGQERTLEDIVRLLTSPQGIEFCIANRFPNMNTFRLFKPFNPERLGVYIDAGEITLQNPAKAVLVGHTVAMVRCDKLSPCHEIYLLHGAKATVNCTGWAVAKVQAAAGCSLIKNVNEHAVILG